jgi:CBS domain-containing protein
MGGVNVPVAEAGPTVGDVMLPDPDVHPPSATVADARRAFESPRQKLLVIADGSRYVGAVRRESAEGDADAEAPITSLETGAVPTLAPSDATERIFEIVDTHDLTRIPVVGEDGTLVGLVCFNRGKHSFCVA